MDTNLNKGSLLDGFRNYVSSKLKLDGLIQPVRCTEIELDTIMNINLNKPVQISNVPVGESQNQREELDRFLNQQSSTNQENSSTEAQNTDGNQSVSIPQDDPQDILDILSLPMPPIQGGVEQSTVLQPIIQQQQDDLELEWQQMQLEWQQSQQEQQATVYDEQYRLQIANEAQMLLQGYLATITSTDTSSSMSTEHDALIPQQHTSITSPLQDLQFAQQLQQSSIDRLAQINLPQLNIQQQNVQQPVAEAGPSSAQTQQPVQQQQQVYQTTQSNIKYEKPVTFNGKHTDTENFIFSMTAYVHAVKMSDRDAAEFLTLYLRGDAMTWWRSYCTTNGGLTNVFATKSFKDLLTELRSEFSDVDREMQLRNKLFNIRQTQSVQQYVTMFRTTMVDLGTTQITAETAKYLFLHGLKQHIRKEVFMHRPTTFQDMILLAERADQAFMSDRSGILQQRTSIGNGFSRGNFGRGQQGFGGQRGGRNPSVSWQNVSQYGNQAYKGPAPMVLGNVGDAGSVPVCYYCNKPGHVKRDCYKFLAASRGGNSGGGRGGRGGRQGGRPGNGGRNLYNNAIAEGTVDVSEVMRLGMAAMANHQRQIGGESRKVSFADQAS